MLLKRTVGLPGVVPGIVKTVAAEGEMELHSYGLSGAKSSF